MAADPLADGGCLDTGYESESVSEVSKEKGAGSEGRKNGEDGMKLTSFDRHDLWQGICDRTRLHDDWNGRIRNAVKRYGNSEGMPQSIRRLVKNLERRAGLDWKQLLHDFLQFDHRS